MMVFIHNQTALTFWYEPADKILDRELSDQSGFASVFYWTQAVKRQLDALLTIPDQIIVQNRYKPPILW